MTDHQVPSSAPEHPLSVQEERESAARALTALGFTELEAAIYTFLLQESPATGYRIAQAIGKPTANTYKALTILEHKGAILVDDSGSRLCRAVPPEELLGQMEHRFHFLRDRALSTLARLGRPDNDERIYHLRTRQQVFERARQMIQRGQRVILLCAFPEILEELRAALEEAADRKVAVIIKTYAPMEIRGADMVLSSESDYVLAYWPGQELSLVVDAEEHLLALLEPDGEGVRQAIWSGSTFLSLIHYNGLYCEWKLTTLARQLFQGASRKELLRSLDHKLHPAETPGLEKLRAGRAGQENSST
jgi:sugar-specific transcriptional regulator TrmB